ncbi:CENPB DNA-binding domain containing protein 1-like 46, partial [Homarus americanus]
MPKRPATKTPSNVAKRSHVAIMLDVKSDIVKRHEHGEGTSVIGCLHGLAPYTVHSIVKGGDKIKEMAGSATPLMATKVLGEKRKNAQQMTLDAFITPKPSTPSAPTTPRTPKQNTAFRQLFKTSVKPQPSTSERQPSTSERQPSTSEPQPSTSGEQQLLVKIDSDNESEVADDPGSDDESEVVDDPGSDDESEVADDPGSEESEVAPLMPTSASKQHSTS